MSSISLSDIIRSEGTWSLKFFKLADYFLGTLLCSLVPAQRTLESAPGPVTQILIIRPGGIGDAVFLLPILKILRSQGMAIDILCEKRNAGVFAAQGYPAYLYNEIGQFDFVLKKSYDAVIDTEQWHYLSALVAYFVKARYKIGFSTRPLRSKLFNKRVVYNENGYELENFIGLFNDFLPAINRPPDINHCFDVPLSLSQWVEPQLPQKSISLFLGGSIGLRRFSQAQVRFFIEEALSKDYHVALLGGKDVEDTAVKVKEDWPDGRILNFVGQISLLQSAAIIQRTQRFIGPDSGLMHLACAVGTPVTAIFGPGNLNKWKPQGRRHKVIRHQVACAPCTRFGYTVTTCQKTYICVRDIPLETSI